MILKKQVISSPKPCVKKIPLEEVTLVVSWSPDKAVNCKAKNCNSSTSRFPIEIWDLDLVNFFLVNY